MNCPNCQSQLSCGCQQRKASNGATVCSNCLSFYEASLLNKSEVVNANTSVPKPTDTTPTDVRISYIPPKT